MSSAYVIVASSSQHVDPALVNTFNDLIAMPVGHLRNAKDVIVKCLLG